MPAPIRPRPSAPPPAPARPAARAALGARLAGPQSYWTLSRAPRYSLLLALPLLLLYEGLAALLGAVDGVAVRNGADVWIKAPFVALLGPRGPLAFGALVAVVALVAIVRDARRVRAPLRPRVFAGMLAEAGVMAVVCGLVVGTATTRLLQGLADAGLAAGAATTLAVAPDAPLAAAGAPTQLMIALGAGLYEELLFRVVLVSALVALGRHVAGLGPAASGLAATVGGALLFSLAHHVGPLGEPFTLAAFTFRALAGLFFSGLYVLRGFGITAWTHALYDVLVLFVV